MRRSSTLTYAIALVVLIAVAVALRLRQPPPQTLESYVAERETRMLARAAQTGKVETVVLGDSIVEMNALDDLCGTSFNAGVGGATIADLRRFAPPVLRATRPMHIVLAIGTNDIVRGGAYVVRFRANYTALIDGLPMRPFAIVGVDGGDNRFIKAEADRIGAAYVPPIARSMTYDGIHPGAAGMKLWRERVAATCPTDGEPRPPD